MPVIRLVSPMPSPGSEVLRGLAEDVTALLGIPSEHCWLWWQQLEPESYHRPEWQQDPVRAAPVGFVVCKESYRTEQVGDLLRLLKQRLGAVLRVPEEEIYLVVQRATVGELLVRNEVWAKDAKGASEE